ncbi:MAG: hypothetical protein QM790_14445 [Nibricoccus sp.]
MIRKILLGLLPIAFLLSGCSTVSSRIEEKSAYFNALDPQTQERIKERHIAVGDSTDMVYIALGQPDRIRESTSAKSQESTWIYNTHFEDYAGSRFMGYQRHTVYNPVTKSWGIYYEPVRAEIYQDRVEEYMRIVFKDGRVAAIEQQKG